MAEQNMTVWQRLSQTFGPNSLLQQDYPTFKFDKIYDGNHHSIQDKVKTYKDKWTNSKNIELLLVNSQIKLLDFGL